MRLSDERLRDLKRATDNGVNNSVCEEVNALVSELMEAREVVAKIVKIHDRNWPWQMEKLADIGPVARNFLKDKETDNADT